MDVVVVEVLHDEDIEPDLDAGVVVVPLELVGGARVQFVVLALVGDALSLALTLALEQACAERKKEKKRKKGGCLLYTSPSPRDS